jgi:hypothetical protein
MEKIPDEIKVKIIGKVLGMFYVRSLEKQNPNITIPEFKYIITRYSLKKKQWFILAKELEKDGIVKLHGGNPIEILRSNIKN